ncbi:PREDICTED: protein MAATS1-like [Nicrophorus vespilloides]|uniref:Cilia- and flagella-associated protein 91 n=1 Tax=Nicrophorus vespilloides TaxID=110193 RepID=A0ABM1M952_NICVS|nr:PREDICTED: protein MAATS1-like [Nicrophorus vespilloides]
MSSTVKASRPNDYMYDSAFIVSGSKDYYKHAVNSKMSEAKYAICPIFPTMFSDMQNYPRKQYVMRTIGPIPQYEPKTQDSKFPVKGILSGVDRYKYYHNAVVPEPSEVEVPKLDMNCFYDIDEEKEKVVEQSKTAGKKKNVTVQTMYRESSAQTSPWQPNFKVVEGDPELLKLDFLKWGSGLPVGFHEISLIERARMKRSWMKPGGPITSIKARTVAIEEVERNEWLFREQEIQDVQNLRMELLEQMLSEIQKKSKCRNEKKMRNFCDIKIKEKQQKLDALHKNRDREMRRLELNYKGILTKYGHVNVFDEIADYKSELYMPLIRHGSNPKYGHQVITKSLRNYKPQYFGVELYDTMPDGLTKCPKIKNLKLPGARLCPRETKWTAPILKNLHKELKTLVDEGKKTVSLRVRIEETITGMLTPEIEHVSDEEEALYQHSVFIQKVLRGRASQISVLQGRYKCRELIEELKSNFTVLKSAKGKITKKIERTKQQQINATRCANDMKLLESCLKKLSANVVGTLLDFLNKELARLHKERACHAMTLLVNRERIKREAAEAGKRQKELRRRKEHDEIFKQTIKIHQETVDLYLQDIITEGMDFTSKEEAKRYVDNLAHQIDEQSRKIETGDLMEKADYIAELVHHFVIPEVEKKMVAQKNKAKQMHNLKEAHETIYGNIETMHPLKHDKHKQSGSSKSSETEIYRERISNIKATMAVNEVTSLLNELVSLPPKLEALRKMKPCFAYSLESIEGGEGEDGKDKEEILGILH